MKKNIILLAYFLLSYLTTYGQVNDTGDKVGIGNSNPDMKLSVLTDKEYVSRFHSTSTQFMAGIRIGKTTGGGSSYADLVNLPDGFGIGAGYSGSNLPLNTQSKDDIAIYTNYSSRNVGIGTTSPDMRLSVSTNNKSVSRFHSTSAELMTGIRIGKTKASGGSSYADLVNLSDGFGISAGYSGSNMPLNTQNKDDIAIYTNYSSRYVGIGTTEPDARLTVKGDIHTREVTVDLAGAVAPDFVFKKDYDLQTLQQVEAYIIQNSHLPDVPSAKDMEENGIELKKMNLKLLQKVEELTLYLIEQNKKINRLEDEVQELKTSK